MNVVEVEIVACYVEDRSFHTVCWEKKLTLILTT